MVFPENSVTIRPAQNLRRKESRFAKLLMKCLGIFFIGFASLR
jgi:hypothetical protein